MRTALFAGIMLSWACTIATAQEYRIVEIESPSLSALAYRINDAGQVLVEHGAYRGTYTDYRVLLWEGGNVRDLNPSGSGAQVMLHSINNGGLGVGYAMRGEETGPVIWRDGQLTFPPTLGIWTDYRRATDVNDRGDAVGFAYVGESGNEVGHALLWRDGQATDLGSLGGRFALAGRINERGQVLGYAQRADGTETPFVWQDGRMLDIGLPSASTAAVGINDAGQVAGSMGTDPVQGLTVAFLWQQGQREVLPPLPGHTWSYAHVLLESGVVIGQSGNNEETRTVRWHDGVVTDMTEAIPGLDQWEWVRLTDANAQGWIVGHGGNGFEQQAFMLVPVPEPSGVAVVLGTTLLLRRTRRSMPTCR